jgi:branched-chain amino acid transport system ATP-binding protein
MNILEVEKLNKTFGGLMAVHDFDMSVEKGEIVGLIGPNGAGKTTLFNMVACFYSPDSGRIIFQGRNLAGMKPYQVCALGIARTFQLTKPFVNNTVLENVMVGAFSRARSAREARRKALQILEVVEFSEYKDVLGHELTTADQKRLEFARALATEPQLLLLDEGMAGLNPAEKVHLLELLRRIRDRGITLVVVEHDMKAVMALCERIILMHRGEKLVEGAPRKVANDPQAIAAYLGEEYATPYSKEFNRRL